MPLTPQDYQAGDALGNSIMNLARSRQRQQLMQQQMMMRQQMQMPEMMHQQMLAEQVQQKMADDAKMQAIAQTIGRARVGAGNLMNPSMGDNPDMLGSAVDLLRGQGAMPQNGMSITREDLVAALNNVAQGLTTQQAAATSAGAASLMTPMNIPQGGVAYNRMGGMVGVGLPKDPTGQEFQFVPSTEYEPGGVFDRRTGQMNSVNALNAQPRLAPRPNDATMLNSLTGFMNHMGGFPTDATNTITAPMYQMGTNLVQRMRQSLGGQQPTAGGTLTPEQAQEFLRQAGGNKDMARQLARQAGFTF